MNNHKKGMHTPTRTPYGRKSSTGSGSISSAGLRKSSFTNQRNSSSSKMDYVDSCNSPNLQNHVNNNASRSTSRNVSRTNSKTYFQQPPQITNSPYQKSMSRSTSRSSSRLSLSSMASTSAGPTSKSSTLFLASATNPIDIGINKSRIQVTVRPRPFGPQEDPLTPWNIDFDNANIHHPELGGFHYDHIFLTNDDNRKVFEVSAAPIIQKCLDGFNATIFAYGMTGSGKTYSMRGVLKDSINMLFNNSNYNAENLHSSTDGPMDYIRNWEDKDGFQNETIIMDENRSIKHITCSIIEIYNEKLRDLLCDNKTGNTRDLRIVDDKRFGIQVYGLSEIKVTSPDQLLELIDQGESLRSTDSTDYNYNSSRSHFIVMLKVFLENGGGSEITSLLNFCDLAGSERATSHADRRVEGGYINKSLLALGTVITKLSESTSSGINVHIPYRDSKLTRLLQPSLSGGSMVSILCTVHMGSNVVGETVNTLRFGSRAKNVLLNVKRNTEELDIGKLMHENELLKIEVNELRGLLELKITQVNESCEHASNLIKTSDTLINDDLYYEIVAENNILNEQVEHLKRLQLEQNIFRTQESNEDLSNLNKLFNSLILDSFTRRKAEEILIGLNNGIKEYKLRFDETESYVGHLENRLRMSEIELARNSIIQKQRIQNLDTANEKLPSLARSQHRAILQSDLDEAISDLQEEVVELKRSLARKDAMIRALQKAVHDR